MKTAKLTMFILFIAALLCGFTGGKAQSGFSPVKRPLDYSDAVNWIVYNDGEDTDADFFFIAPTVSASEGYNMPADETSSLTSFLIQTNVYRDIFAPNARTFSPVYRQTTITAFSLPLIEWHPFFEFAY